MREWLDKRISKSKEAGKERLTFSGKLFGWRRASKVKVLGREGHFVGKTKKTRLTNKILRNGGSEIATESEKVKEI